MTHPDPSQPTTLQPTAAQPAAAPRAGTPSDSGLGRPDSTCHPPDRDPWDPSATGQTHCGGHGGGVRLEPPAPARMPPRWPVPHLSAPPLPRFGPLGGRSGPGSTQGSPLARWLVDPGGYLREAGAWWWSALIVYGPLAGAGVILASIAAVSLRRMIDIRRLERWHTRARWVLIVLPPTVEPEGGQRLWERLHAIARPWHVRLRHGQPHVGFETFAEPGRIVIGMWVPSVIPPGLVEHAIRGAWPGVGVDTTQSDIPDPVPDPPFDRIRVTEGARLVLGRHSALPLRTHHTADPLRVILASLHGLSDGQSACIQILARPLTGGLRVMLARRAAIRMATSPTVKPSLLAMHSTGGRLARLALDAGFALLRLLLDVLSPTTLATTSGGRGAGYRDQPGRRGTRPPFTRDIASASGTKTGAAQSMWAVQTVLVTSTTVAADATPAAARNTRQACRGDAATLAAGFRVFAAHNQLRRRRLRHPDSLGLRAMPGLLGGQLMGTDELAALAHLPLDERTAGLDRAGANPVAPPPGIPTGDTTPTPTDSGTGGATASTGRPGEPATGEAAAATGQTTAAPSGPTTTPAAAPTPSSGPTEVPVTAPAIATPPAPTAPPGVAAAAPVTPASTPTGAAGRVRARNLPPGPGRAVANWAGAVVLGDSNAGTRRPIALSVRDRSRHLLLLGSTGCGKSCLMARMVLADAATGRGVVLCDPKTDAALDVYDRLDPAARERLVLIDPDAPGPVPLLNLLDPHDPVAVDNLVAIFASIYRRSWGDRIAESFRMGCQAVIAHYHHRARQAADQGQDLSEVEIPTLRDVLNLLTKAPNRQRIVSDLAASSDEMDRDVATFWAAFHRRSDAGQDRDSAAVLNKLRGLLIRDRFTRALLTGDGPPMDMTAVLDGGICLARLPEGLLGADTTSLIGSLLVAKVWQATTARARQREHERAPAALYLDEAHRFLHLHTPIDTMLSQARGFGLGMVLALQNFAQLGTREIREGVSANTLHKLFFRLSTEDAAYAERHTYPLLTAHDLSHLDNFTAAARLQPDGIDRPAFTLQTRPLPNPAIGTGPQPATTTNTQTRGETTGGPA